MSVTVKLVSLNKNPNENQMQSNFLKFTIWIYQLHPYDLEKSAIFIQQFEIEISKLDLTLGLVYPFKYLSLSDTKSSISLNNG